MNVYLSRYRMKIGKALLIGTVIGFVVGSILICFFKAWFWALGISLPMRWQVWLMSCLTIFIIVTGIMLVED